MPTSLFDAPRRTNHCRLRYATLRVERMTPTAGITTPNRRATSLVPKTRRRRFQDTPWP